MNKIHFIGIAGKAMAPLAKMFKDMGWKVTGSDHSKTYPPISTYLRENKIFYHEGYSAQNIVGPPRLGEAGKPDLVIVGRSALLVDSKNPEYLKAKEMKLKILSFPEVLRDYLIKKNSIVVAGTYGKTTISGLLAWILEKAGFNPSFMIGGVPLNFPNGIRNTDSLWSVVEGDEPPALKETDPPKFMFYKPKYLLLTACQWDHPEIFKTEKDYMNAFVQLIKVVPEDGLLIACLDGKNVKKVASVARCPVVWYSANAKNAKKVNFWVEEVRLGGNFTRFEIRERGKRRTRGMRGEKWMIESPLLGFHNVQNVCGAVALALELGIKPAVIQKAVKSYKGIRTRLEFVGEFGGARVFWDLAQHPAKVKETLAALRTRFKDSKIFCVFDPHQSMLQRRESLDWYPGSFDQADEVVVTRMNFSKSIPKKERVTGKDIVEAIKKTQSNVNYQPIDKKVVEYLTGNAKKGDVVIFMSSGGQRTPWIIQKLFKN